MSFARDYVLSKFFGEGSSGSGGGSGILAYDMGEFVLGEDVPLVYITDGIPHQLGEAPDFVLIWTDDFADLSADNVNPYGHAVSVGYCWLNGFLGMTQKLTSVVSTDDGIHIFYGLAAGAYMVSIGVPSSGMYCMSESFFPTAEKIALLQLTAPSQKWKAGVTYKYFVSKAWWNVGGVENAN